MKKNYLVTVLLNKMDSVEFIKVLYPDVYAAAKQLFTYEKKVNQLIDDTYGKDSLDSILYLNEFHKEIENVRKHKLKDTQLNRFAQKFNKYFVEYTSATYNLRSAVGTKQTFAIMESLEKYFKTQV